MPGSILTEGACHGRLRLICHQDIYKIPDEQLIAQAKVTVTGIQNGRPSIPPVVAEKLRGVLATG